MKKPIMPTYLESVYAEYMALPLQQRVGQMDLDINKVAQNDFQSNKEAFELMRLNMWRLEWIGYAGEIKGEEAMIQLVDLYINFGRWSNKWEQVKIDQTQRELILKTAHDWSDKYLSEEQI